MPVQNVETIANLTAGSGTPLVDDPQIFLGSLMSEGLYRDDDHRLGDYRLHPKGRLKSPPSFNNLSIPTTSTYPLRQIHMSFCSKDHYKPHPCLAIRPDGFIQLTSIDSNLIVHPAQLVKYLDHDKAIWDHQITVDLVAPARYKEWAAAYNSSKGDNPCEFATFDIVTELYNCDSFTIPRSLLTIPFFDNRYSELCVLGIIDGKGDLIEGGWANVKNALLCPHREAVRNQARSDARKAKRALKKLRIHDNPFKGYPLISQHSSQTFVPGGTGVQNTADLHSPQDLPPVEPELMPIDQLSN
ncbi:hypothetical protein C0993_005019 [Termitomyces sp. T159_Od127]|nr:hypothetical protein C0993_005019 [Termitomyces sp. T159_Od127]